jgi:antitoxin VapB
MPSVYTQVKEMIQTSIFKRNKTQAVRLPNAVVMPDDVKEVGVIKVVNRRIISPTGTGWDEWFESGNVTDDFMVNRNQPEVQTREYLDD